jgi:hypothetical protein
MPAKKRARSSGAGACTLRTHPSAVASHVRQLFAASFSIVLDRFATICEKHNHPRRSKPQGAPPATGFILPATLSANPTSPCSSTTSECSRRCPFQPGYLAGGTSEQKTVASGRPGPQHAGDGHGKQRRAPNWLRRCARAPPAISGTERKETEKRRARGSSGLRFCSSSCPASSLCVSCTP